MKTPHVKVRSLTVSYLKGSGLLKERFEAVSKLSFEIERNRCFGLVGESGSGKSTVVKALLGLADIDDGYAQIGKFRLPGLRGQQLRSFRASTQVVFQDPYLSLNPRLSIGRIIEEPLIIHGVPSASRKERVAQVLYKVQLEAALMTARPSQLSGGQRQRVSIARALILQPKFLIADEPVSALDLSVQARIIDLLADLKEQLELTMLFVSHDMELVQFLADEVGVMYAGRLVEVGPPAVVFKNPVHPYTRELISAVPSNLTRSSLSTQHPERKTPRTTGCPFGLNCPDGDMKCRYESPPLIMVSPDHRAACYKALSSS